MKIKQFVFNPFGVNCYVLSNAAGDAILIDPSVSNQHERNTLSEYIKNEGLVVRHVLNTHLHLDHVLGNAFVQHEFGVKAEAHEEDNFLLDLQEEQSQMFGLRIEQIAPPLGNFLAEGDIIELPEIKLDVIHIAGHSPGGVAFYCEVTQSDVKSNPILFSGDILFAGSVGRSDLFFGDEESLIKGIKNKLLTLPSETIVYPGHGSYTTIRQEREFF